jgi:hypothetical protein
MDRIYYLFSNVIVNSNNKFYFRYSNWDLKESNHFYDLNSYLWLNLNIDPCFFHGYHRICKGFIQT